MLYRQRTIDSKVKSPLALKKFLNRLEKQGTKNKGLAVTFTNGCFDLLHSGHVSYLERARKKGDLLVVALNTDASIRRLKGVGRPLNPLQDRLKVLAALESVDFVTWFEDDTPLRLIQLLKPKVLVKGGDWKTDAIVGGAEVRSWGGRVYSLKYLLGKSTTDLISKAKRI